MLSGVGSSSLLMSQAVKMMFNLRMTSVTLKLLPFVCLCLLTGSAVTSADENEPDVAKVIVEEGSDAILPCQLKIRRVNTNINWIYWKKDGYVDVFTYGGVDNFFPGDRFEGRVSHFPEGAKSGNASIIIRNTTVADIGDYTCEGPPSEPKPQIFHIKLSVVGGVLKDRTADNIVGAAPKPYTKVLDVTEFGTLLQCEVEDAFPEPKVEWQDSDGKVLPAEKPQVSERGGRFDVTLLANVTKTKTNLFRCVAKQEEISHIIADDIYADEIKVIVEEGRDAILPCSLSTKENIELFDWRKDGQKKVFMYDASTHYNNCHGTEDQQFKGRVLHFPDELKSGNASIIIRNTEVADSGDYTCEFPRLQPEGQIFHIKLVVGAAANPSISIQFQTKDKAVLGCVVLDASPKPRVEWRDDEGNVLPVSWRKVKEIRGLFYISLTTTVTEARRRLYRCYASQKETKYKAYAKTYVHIDGEAAKPSIAILEETKDGTLLQCEVQDAFPKPELRWEDKDRNILPAKEPQVIVRGNRYDVILQTTVTKADKYRCVATQWDIVNLVSAETYVPIHGSSAGSIVGAVFGTLFVVGVVLAVLVKMGYITLNSKKDTSGVL